MELINPQYILHIECTKVRDSDYKFYPESPKKTFFGIYTIKEAMSAGWAEYPFRERQSISDIVNTKKRYMFSGGEIKFKASITITMVNKSYITRYFETNEDANLYVQDILLKNKDLNLQVI